MTVIRARQGVLTRAHPHNANRTHLIPGGQRQWRNMLQNSRLYGAGGDYSYGDFVLPEHWNQQVFPPADAEAWPGHNRNAIHFFGDGVELQGFLEQRVPLIVGQLYHIRCEVLEVNGTPSRLCLFLAGPGPQHDELLQPAIPSGPGVLEGIYRATTNEGRFRFGLGVSAQETNAADFVLTEPQISGGNVMLPWQGTGLNPGPWDETIGVTVGQTGDSRGYVSGVGAIDKQKLFTHQIRTLHCNVVSDNFALQIGDIKQYGIPAMRMQHSADPGNWHALPWNGGINAFYGNIPGIGALWDAEVGNVVQTRFVAEF